MERAIWQIIQADNYARETVVEVCIMRLYMTKETGQGIADLLNQDVGGGEVWYVVRDSKYKPWRGMEEFV